MQSFRGTHINPFTPVTLPRNPTELYRPTDNGSERKNAGSATVKQLGMIDTNTAEGKTFSLALRETTLM
jgi:hypothetical protein